MGNTTQQQGVGTEKFAKTEGEQKPRVSAHFARELTPWFLACDLGL